MTMIKSFETWFLREHGDGNFSRLESGEYAGEYADLAVRNYWGVWQGVWGALVEQQPDVAGLVEALHEGRRAIGDHHVPDDCYATGPVTGDPFRDLVQCPACSFIAMYDAALAVHRNQGGEV